MKSIHPFHVAVPVFNLIEARDFYVNNFNCQIGRTSEQWIDLNLYGHQFVLHLKSLSEKTAQIHNAVDGKNVPVPHYGVILPWEDWGKLADRLNKNSVEFVIAPYIRFKGEVGEQATLFLLDPSGNALEFKAFKNIDQLFAH